VICPKCGTENKTKFKFCVKCGSNLEDPSEVNIEQVDMGGYRSEEDYTSEKNSFKIGSGTFTISDRAPETSNGMFTADELNDTDEEFDFSNIDEPFIPKLDADRVKIPTGAPQQPMQNPAMQGMGMNPQQPMQNPAMQGMGMPPQQPMQNPAMQGMGMNPQQPMQNPAMQGMGMNPQQPMQNPAMPGMGMNQMYGGQPMYGQPMMAQPQIIGYDQNGMPIYGQPMMAQPVVIGYDQNGMPIYGQSQPMMYGQPVVVGYDQNGMPIYGQSQPMMYGMQPQMNEQGEHAAPMGMPAQGMAPMQGMQGVQGMQGMPGMYGMPQAQPQQPQPQQQNANQVKVPNKFWNEFFSEDGDEGDGQDDFFGKPRQGAGNMGGVSADGLDMSRLKKNERKKRTYMNDTPDVDASALKPNESDKFNKMFMRGTAQVNADDLQENQPKYKRNYMNAAGEVDADTLEVHEHKKTKITMKFAGEANADELQAYEAEHKEALMAQADHAVEALPKKKAAVVDEIDAIELPAHMQARKTVHNENPEIPGLPEI